jgi:tetratricopeptide (TPR) repeat protein
MCGDWGEVCLAQIPFSTYHFPMSFKIEHPQRRLTLSLAGCGLLLWGFYLATLSPAFPPDDSPETVAAAFSLGIQHPPGYPLAALLGRCAIVALPLGSPAFRVNLLSAFLACGAALLAGALAWRLTPSETGRPAAAALAALGLGFLAVFWDQATEAKGGLYLLNLALGFGLWHVVLDTKALGLQRSALTWGGLAGLMLADHYPSALLWLLPTGAWLLRRMHEAGSLRLGRWAALAVLPGLSLYLYLPLRAGFAPLLNWGDPSTWRQFWWMVSRSGYSQAAVTDAGVAADQARLWWASLWQPGLAWLLPLAILGLGLLWMRRQAAAIYISATIALALIAALAMNKTLADERWLALIFALPASALLAPLAGPGLAALGGSSRRLGRLGILAALGLGLGAASGRFQRCDRSGSYAAWDYARDLSLSLPHGGLYMAEGDYHFLPLLYLQAVEGRRADLQCVLNALVGEGWYQGLLQRRDAQLRLPAEGPAGAASVEMALLNARRRPLRLGPYSAWLNAQSLGQGLRQTGLTRALGPPQAGPDQSLAWAAREPSRQGDDLEPVETALLPWYTVALVQTGNDAMQEHWTAVAISAYQRALARPGPKPEAPLNFDLGLAYEQAGRKDLALSAYQRSQSLDPGFAPAAQRLQALAGKP